MKYSVILFIVALLVSCIEPMHTLQASAQAVPTSMPTTYPTTYPTTAPTTAATSIPAYATSAPTTVPTTYPTTKPTTAPTTVPTTYPTTVATTAPTTKPTTYPTVLPGTPPPGTLVAVVTDGALISLNASTLDALTVPCLTARMCAYSTQRYAPCRICTNTTTAPIQLATTGFGHSIVFVSDGTIRLGGITALLAPGASEVLVP